MQGALQTTEKAPPQMTVSVRLLINGYHVIPITTLTKHLTLDEFHLIFKNKDQMETVRLLDL